MIMNVEYVLSKDIKKFRICLETETYNWTIGIPYNLP